MLRKKIKYVDFNDVEREEEFLFNLSKAELTEMELSAKGGLKAQLERIIAEENGEKIIAMFKRIILDSYGVKSDDGKSFIKNEELKRNFEQSNAYSELFMELASDAQAAAAFVNAIVPQIK